MEIFFALNVSISGFIRVSPVNLNGALIFISIILTCLWKIYQQGRMITLAKHQLIHNSGVNLLPGMREASSKE